jgi:hypothetical protein
MLTVADATYHYPYLQGEDCWLVILKDNAGNAWHQYQYTTPLDQGLLAVAECEPLAVAPPKPTPKPTPKPMPTPTPTPTPGGCAAKPLPNLTVPSKFNLGAPAPAASTEACCARCAAAAGCRAWTLNPKGACQLKSEAKFIYQSLYYSGRAV